MYCITLSHGGKSLTIVFTVKVDHALSCLGFLIAVLVVAAAGSRNCRQMRCLCGRNCGHGAYVATITVVDHSLKPPLQLETMIMSDHVIVFAFPELIKDLS